MIDQPAIPTPRRVLIIKPSALGDVVTALPVLRGLRRTFGDSVHVAWLLNTSCAAVVRHDSQLDEAIHFDRGYYGRMWRDPRAAWAFHRFCKRLRQGEFDWVIDLQGLLRSGWFTRATRSTLRAGFGDAREGATLFYNHTVDRESLPAHTVDRNIALARSLGIDARGEDFRLEVPAAGRAFAEQFAAKHGGDFAVVAPATRWITKLYPSRHWRVVIDRLLAGVVGKVVLIAGAGETHLAEPLAGRPGVVNLAGKTGLPEMVGLIAASRVLLSCDSAPMHIAAALGTPQVTVIGPTDPARTGPYARTEAVMQIHLPCRACRLKRCAHISCMQLIAPGEVVAAAHRVLALA